MKAELKSFFSSDLDRSSLPDNVDNCEVWIQAEIGVKNSEASDIFQFGFVTTTFLSEQEGNTPIIPRGLIIIKQFDWQVVENTLKKIVASEQGENWHDLATKLNKYGLWEFENYEELEGQ